MSETPSPPHDADGARSDAPHPHDLRLVADTLAGDPAAIESFVLRMRCVPRFVAVRNARTGHTLDHETEADVVQDVLTVVWRKLRSFAGEATLETWVYQFVEFEFRNTLRRRDRRRMASLDERARDSEPAEPRAVETDLEELYLGLEALEPIERAIVRLRNFDAMTFEAIAVRIAAPLNTVKSRYYRGLEKLRAVLHRREDRA